MRHRIFRFLLWLFALSLLGGLIVAFFALRGQTRYAVQPNLTRVVIKGNVEEDFLKKDDLLKALPLNLSDTLPLPISLSEIEQTIHNKVPYVKRAEAYVSPTRHQMTVRVVSRKPILRYFTDGGSYYLDDEGVPMETKVGAAVYVPVVFASRADSITIEQTLYPLAQFFQEHSEWATFFSSIELKENNKIHLYPRVGDYIFEVIGVHNLAQELPKIKIFYTKIVPQVGANKYQLIKLSYSGQIVCKRR